VNSIGLSTEATSATSFCSALPNPDYLLYSITICRTCSGRRIVFSPVHFYGKGVFRLKLQSTSSANAQIKIVNPLEGPVVFPFLQEFPSHK